MSKILLIASLFAYGSFSSSTTQTDEHFIVLLGNTGAGKSFFANFLLPQGSDEFYSSYSPASVTAEFLAKPSVFEGWQVADTPGLNDNCRWFALISNEIKKALTASRGQYKLCFVLDQAGGRVRAEDILTIRLILSAIKEDMPYYILGNLYGIGVTSINYEEDFKSVANNLIQSDLRNLPRLRLPEAYLFLPKIDENNKPDSITKFGSFVAQMKSGKITQVSDILYISDEVKKDLEKLLNDPEKYQELLRPIRKDEKITPYSYWPSAKALMLISCGAILAVHWFNH